MENLLIKLRKAYPDHYGDIKKAYTIAAEAHKGQKRSSGEDYIIHPCAVVEILADFGFDSSTVIAAFLHDVLEDTDVTADELRQEFGDEIVSLVEGVTKLDKLKFNNREEAQAENFRKLFMALAKDLRVIIIKLADRLHNMRSLEYLPHEKQQYISRETLDIYAPLAGRLGISFFKCELEDIAMKYLYPVEYKDIVERTQEIRQQSQVFLDEICKTLTNKLKEMGLNGEVNGRPKHYYSILKKLRKANIEIDQVYDLLAVRIITDSVKDCYALLGEVHNLWKPIPGRFKDYIAMPRSKENRFTQLLSHSSTKRLKSKFAPTKCTKSQSMVLLPTGSIRKARPQVLKVIWKAKSVGFVKLWTQKKTSVAQGNLWMPSVSTSLMMKYLSSHQRATCTICP